MIALAVPALGRLLPDTIAHDFERQVIDRDWVIQRRMPGVPLTAADASLPPGERAALWLELGRLTRALHEVRGPSFGPPVHGQRFNLWSDLLLHDAGGLIEDAGRFALPPSPFERLRRVVRDLASVIDAGVTPRLVHSDLAPSHVFVEPMEEGPHRIAGIIDLEFGRFGDPQMERLITTLRWEEPPATIASSFFRGYGRKFASPEDRTRLHLYVAIALGWSATLLVFHGHRDGLPEVIAKMEQALRYLDS